MNSSQTTSSQALDHFDQFLSALCAPGLILHLRMEAQTVNRPITIYVRMDGACVYEQQMTDGNYEIDLNLSLAPAQYHTLTIGMLGKQMDGTLLEDGCIVRDTYAKILDWKINNYCLASDHDFFRDHVTYHNHDLDSQQTPTLGFWSNSQLDLIFQEPFDVWYNSTSTKNATLAAEIKHDTNTMVDQLAADLERALDKLD